MSEQIFAFSLRHRRGALLTAAGPSLAITGGVFRGRGDSPWLPRPASPWLDDRPGR
ncbi:hypothetical protein [Methylacidimicrobium sp. B4]|uniref:hypothetical protein n=1 Tax=Methylacidimicrobium sp. B4 TaxID=2796139 RepID=UPI001A8D30FC|nr:hypothetical protein [Methylacidimicrobium sp. B4]QSR84795.1 hypothetical protein MacB4_00445 [Methylacidimicrobium sp. B4]